MILNVGKSRLGIGVDGIGHSRYGDRGATWELDEKDLD